MEGYCIVAAIITIASVVLTINRVGANSDLWLDEEESSENDCKTQAQVE